MTTKTEFRAIRTISSKSNAYKRRKFEESFFEELLDIAENLPSLRDRDKVHELVWALRNYLVTITGEFRVRDHND